MWCNLNGKLQLYLDVVSTNSPGSSWCYGSTRVAPTGPGEGVMGGWGSILNWSPQIYTLILVVNIYLQSYQVQTQFSDQVGYEVL